ncbi:TetR family transcriptional regulator, partial [Mycobacterium sp. ITM-2017-0098]
VKLCAAAVTGAFRVIDEEVSIAVIVEKVTFTQSEGLALMDRAISEATNGRLGGPVVP